jgi:hypothetical protein
VTAVSSVTWARWAGVLALLAVGCGEPPPVVPPSARTPAITSVDAPAPMLVGTTIRVVGRDFDRLGDDPILEVQAADGATFVLSTVPHDEEGELLFEMSGTGFAMLVPSGALEALADVSLVLDGAGVRSDPFDARWELSRDLPLSLDEDLSGDVHWNDVVVLDGTGFVSASEGTLEAHVVGTFTPESGAPMSVDVRLPLSLVDRTSRSRSVVVLSTALGRNALGTLEGTIVIESTLLGGSPRLTPERPVSLRFLGPELYAFDPDLASLGETVRLRGAGFLGGLDHPDETTLIRIDGTFTPPGGTAEPFSMELVPALESGTSLLLVIETRVSEGRLVSSLFGAARGTLEGLAAPITLSDGGELEGVAVPFRFTLGPPRQVVHLRFLPGYYDSLARFGLAAAAQRIEDGIVTRIEGIFEGVNVDIRLETPDDFDVRNHAVVEIGGPDPNGNGLFGYDNSPGKDVGNLRLFDHIGGANAQTQMDGSPGYGGVFVESMLWWSSHPDLGGTRPPSSPDVEPLFDDIFDPVRRTPATLAEVMGSGDPDRIAAVDRAIRALSSIIGETTAHELGHSFGLAQPYGERTVFHNDVDGDGCLMDRGGDRPLEERAEEPGAPRTMLCYDEPAYMAEILGGE